MSSEAELQTELQSLSKRLEDRLSIVHFAWAFGLACAAFMGVGVGIKLFHDSIRTPKLAFVLLAVGMGCAIVAAIRLTRGFKLFAAEGRDYQRFMTVRSELGLDRPQLPSA
ncbi:MAG: hypothetical protein JST54_04125 [Deltaproteobacteria bacterium]|nr:hypothetical protein [Deltaproteobacteria bacterium]